MISSSPLVSVICTCYNQERFIDQAIRSVIDQSYQQIELIVIDDNSSDNSREVIMQTIKDHPGINFLANPKNQGLCKNFNQGLKQSKGKYLIDLSGDDFLETERIKRQVAFFEDLSPAYGVIFSNAEMISEQNKTLKKFYPVDSAGQVKKKPPDGDIYTELIRKYFIAAPTVMMKREMLQQMGGYDEDLAYEDFDFWIRSSRHWQYAYQDEVLTRIRKTSGSLSSRQYAANDGQLMSTYMVCQKIRQLNRSKEEDNALIGRLKYEIRQAVLAEKREEAKLFLELLSYMEPLSIGDRFLKEINKRQLKTIWFRDVLKKIG